MKYKDRINIICLFLKNFKYEKNISFNHRFIRNISIECKESNIPNPYQNRIFLLEKRGTVIYADFQIDLFTSLMIIQKNLNADFNYQTFAISADKLKQLIIEKLKKKGLLLYSIIERKMVNFNPNSSFENIFFFHSNCSPCQLKSFFSKIKLSQIINSERNLVIFSFFSNIYAIEKAIAEEGIIHPVYLDSNDFFEIYSYILNEESNPIVVKKEEIGGIDE